jgi:hypothetical protein
METIEGFVWLLHKVLLVKAFGNERAVSAEYNISFDWFS